MMSKSKTPSCLPTGLLEKEITQMAESEIKASIPTKNTSPANTKLIAQTRSFLIIMLITLIFCEGAARVIVTASEPPQFGSKEFDSKYRVARGIGENKHQSILFLGTSYTSRGVYSDLLESLLNEKGLNLAVYNLAASGSLPADQLFLAETAIANGARPSMIVYDITPAAAYSESSHVSEYSGRFIHSYMGQSIACKDNSLFGIDRLKRWAFENIYLARYRSHLHTFLLSIPSRLIEPDNHYFGWNEKAVHRESSQTGWAPAYNVADRQILALSIAERKTMLKFMESKSGPPTKLDPIPALKALCQSRHIPLVLAWYPIHSSAAEFHTANFALPPAELGMLLKKLAEENGMEFLDLHDNNNNNHFINCDHLNAAGAVHTTERIAELLTRPPFHSHLDTCGIDN